MSWNDSDAEKRAPELHQRIGSCSCFLEVGCGRAIRLFFRTKLANERARPKNTRQSFLASLEQSNDDAVKQIESTK